MTLSAPYLPSSLARPFRPLPIARAHSLVLRRSASLLPSVTASSAALRKAGPEDSARTRTSPVSFQITLASSWRSFTSAGTASTPFPTIFPGGRGGGFWTERSEERRVGKDGKCRRE